MILAEENKPGLYIGIKAFWYMMKFSGRTISELKVIIYSANDDTIMGCIEISRNFWAATLWRKDGRCLYDEKYDLKLRLWFSFVKGLFVSFK